MKTIMMLKFTANTNKASQDYQDMTDCKRFDTIYYDVINKRFSAFEGEKLVKANWWKLSSRCEELCEVYEIVKGWHMVREGYFDGPFFCSEAVEIGDE